MGGLRISRGERYSDDFEPEGSFVAEPDDSTRQAVMIYDGSMAEEDPVIDLSGNGNDGEWKKD